MSLAATAGDVAALERPQACSDLEPQCRPPLSAWLADAWSRVAAVQAVQVEGAVVRYRSWGLGAHRRPGLMLVHGFMAHARWWDHIAPHFMDRHAVVAPDFTGMGDSDRRSVYSRRQYARELVAAVGDAGLDRVTLVAHSFGAVAALYAAKLAPELIDRVIVIDAHVFRSEDETGIPVQPEKTYPSLKAALERYRLTPPGVWPDPEVGAYIARHSVRDLADGRWGWKFDPEICRSVHRERLHDELKGLPIAVDFIKASDSELVGETELAAFLTHMPACGDPVTVPLSHHHIKIEQPLGLVAALNGLLAHPRS